MKHHLFHCSNSCLLGTESPVPGSRRDQRCPCRRFTHSFLCSMGKKQDPQCGSPGKTAAVLKTPRCCPAPGGCWERGAAALSGSREHPRAPTLCRQSWHSIVSTLQALMWLLSLFRCFFTSQTFLERKTMTKFPVDAQQQCEALHHFSFCWWCFIFALLSANLSGSELKS